MSFPPSSFSILLIHATSNSTTTSPSSSRFLSLSLDLTQHSRSSRLIRTYNRHHCWIDHSYRNETMLYTFVNNAAWFDVLRPYRPFSRAIFLPLLDQKQTGTRAPAIALRRRRGEGRRKRERERIRRGRARRGAKEIRDERRWRKQ